MSGPFDAKAISHVQQRADALAPAGIEFMADCNDCRWILSLTAKFPVGQIKCRHRSEFRLTGEHNSTNSAHYASFPTKAAFLDDWTDKATAAQLDVVAKMQAKAVGGKA